MNEKTDSSTLGSFEKQDEIFRRLGEMKSILCTVSEAHCYPTSIFHIDKIGDTWRLTGTTNIEHVYMEMEGDYRGKERIGEIAFEPYVLGVPQFITGLVNINEELFNKLWKQIVSDNNALWKAEIAFSSAPESTEWVPVSDIKIRKSYTRR